MQETKQPPTIVFESIESVMDVQNRYSSGLLDPSERAGLHSDEGRAMAKARVEIEWRVGTPREGERPGREVWLKECLPIDALEAPVGEGELPACSSAVRTGVHKDRGCSTLLSQAMGPIPKTAYSLGQAG